MDIGDNTFGLQRQMLQKPLYVALRVPKDLSRFGEFLEAHLRWAIAAEERGDLFASGPFVADEGVPGALGGMSILQAASAQEATRIVSEDPFIREQIYTASITKWLLMEGGLTVTLRFSERSYTLT